MSDSEKTQVKQDQIDNSTDVETAPDQTEDRNGWDSDQAEEFDTDRQTDDQGVTLADYEAAIKQRDEFLADLQRLQAEFDNYRKRMIKERSELKDFMLQDFMTSLLDVVDNFDRALSADANQESHDSFRAGIEMIRQQLMTVLFDQGLETISAKGEPFDPNVHEAVAQTESAEHQPGTVIEEFMAGYQLKGRVIRAAKVQVAAPGSGTEANHNETNENE